MVPCGYKSYTSFLSTSQPSRPSFHRLLFLFSAEGSSECLETCLKKPHLRSRSQTGLPTPHSHWLPHLILGMFPHSVAEITPAPADQVLGYHTGPASPVLTSQCVSSCLSKPDRSQHGFSCAPVRMKAPTSSAQAHVPAFFTKLAGLGRRTPLPPPWGW